jgi:DNA modification methylase
VGKIKSPHHYSNNRLLPEDRAVHDWYRFVLSYPPHLVRDYLKKFGVTGAHRILDPFCGTGTTLVECKKNGIPSVGIEATPMASFACRIKVDWMPDSTSLLEHARVVASAAIDILISQGIEENPALLFPGKNHNGLLNLSQEQQDLLLKDSISPLPMHKALVLLECIRNHQDGRYTGHERLAFAKTVVFTASNLHFGPEVGVGNPKDDAPVIDAWMAEIRSMASDLEQLRKKKAIPAEVHQADAREILQVLPPQSVDAVITSPPYPNEKDYTRTTRLESVLLGFLNSKEDLRAVKKNLVRSNSRNVYKDDDDDRWIAPFPEIYRLAEAIENRRIEMGKTSGFERMYARVTKLYFGGMARHLADLRKILRPGAKLAYVVGDQASYLQVMIRTGQILADIGRSLGYDVVGIDLFRTRLATATKEQLREEVVVLRWPG